MRVTPVLAVTALLLLGACKKEGVKQAKPQNPYLELCRRVTALMEDPKLDFDGRTAAFEREIKILVPRNPSKAVAQLKRFGRYVDFVKTFNGTAGVDPKDKIRLLRMGAREQGWGEWSCPGLVQWFSRRDDLPPLEKACDRGC
jgi:hypothetical protein